MEDKFKETTNKRELLMGELEMQGRESKGLKEQIEKKKGAIEELTKELKESESIVQKVLKDLNFIQCSTKK